MNPIHVELVFGGHGLLFDHVTSSSKSLRPTTGRRRGRLFCGVAKWAREALRMAGTRSSRPSTSSMKVKDVIDQAKIHPVTHGYPSDEAR